MYFTGRLHSKPSFTRSRHEFILDLTRFRGVIEGKDMSELGENFLRSCSRGKSTNRNQPGDEIVTDSCW